MDLGYSSSDGSGSDSDDESTKNPRPATATATATTQRKQPPSRLTSTSSGSKLPPTVSKKGRKILSLTSVLPKHILDQLTKSQARGEADGDATSDSDSDDNSENNTDIKNGGRPSSKPETKLKPDTSHSTGGGLHAGEDGALNSLLKELSSTKANANAKPKQSKPATVLGAAFVTSTTETIVRSKKSASKPQPSVRNIHSEKASSSTTATSQFETNLAVKVSTVANGSSSENGDENDSDDDDDSSGNGNGNQSVNKPVPERVKSAKASALNSSVPRPTVRNARSAASIRVNSAPRSSVPLPPPPAPSSSTVTQPYPSVSMSASASAYPTYASTPAETDAHINSNSSSRKNSKKSRKRQMEAMLRQGNLGAVQSDFTLQGHDSSSYQLSAEELASQQQQQNNGPQFQNVNVQMYNVKTGGTTTANTKDLKHSGKNQLTHLMASAAALEVAKFQNPQNASNAKTNRASAKRKYGW